MSKDPSANLPMKPQEEFQSALSTQAKLRKSPMSKEYFLSLPEQAWLLFTRLYSTLLTIQTTKLKSFCFSVTEKSTTSFCVNKLKRCNPESRLFICSTTQVRNGKDSREESIQKFWTVYSHLTTRTLSTCHVDLLLLAQPWRKSLRLILNRNISRFEADRQPLFKSKGSNEFETFNFNILKFI